MDIGAADTVGVFGEYNSLTLNMQKNGIKTVLMQDIAADTAYDVSADVKISDGKIAISGELIERICKQSQSEGDTSEPGIAVRLS